MKKKHYAICISPYYEKITDGLLAGACGYLDAQKASYELFYAPGAFEIPLIAKKLATTKKFRGIICLGCVIQGETAHFDFICAQAAQGIMTGMLETGIPISFGILTVLTEAQAKARSRADKHNKGVEAARACLETAKVLACL